MPEAHDTNDSGIQHFSATQTSAQVQEALSRAYPDKYEYEAQDFTTAPLTTPVEGTPQQLDAMGNVIPPPEPVADSNAAPPVDPNAPPKRIKPGRRERELMREVRARDEQIAALNTGMAELRGMILGRTQTPPAKIESVTNTEPVVETSPEPAGPPPVEVAKFDKPQPKRDAFFDQEDPESAYDIAMAEWVVDRREFNRKAADDAAKATEARKEVAKVQQTVEEDWQGSLTAARTEFTDFDEVLKTPHFDAEKKPLPIVNNAMHHVARNWTDAEGKVVGAKILYWLGTHPKEANELAVKTFVKDATDTRQVEKSIRMIHKEFEKIEADLAANPPKAKAAEPVTKQVTPPAEEVDDDYDDETDEDELATDPNLLPVTSDPAAGKKVAQGPPPGAVDTKAPQASQQPPVRQAEPKPEPVSRVGSRGHSANRPVQALPPDAVKQMTPEEFRRKRALEGSTAARG
jgi:hypothetical protein